MKIISTFFLLLIPLISIADEIAKCGFEKGYSYYPFHGVVSKDKSGWRKDAVNGNKLTVTKVGKNWDILFTDAGGLGVHSAKQDGAEIFPVRRSSDDLAIIVILPASTEIYTFTKTLDKKFEYSHLISKGEGLKKSSSMVGVCDYINFEFDIN